MDPADNPYSTLVHEYGSGLRWLEDRAVAAVGHDRRRLWPNLLVGGVSADAETGWPGPGTRRR